MTNVPNANLWCHVCQRQFCSSSALYQHGKRLSHLRRAMKIASSRCTTITNGIVTSSVQRINLVGPSSNTVSTTPLPDCTPTTSVDSSLQDPIIIRRNRNENLNITSYTCNLCSCRCWSIRNIHRHIRLHANVRPFHCNLCLMKFKSHGNLIKHLKTSRHQLNKAHDGKPWAIDTEAMKEQNRLVSQVQFIDDEQNDDETAEAVIMEKQTTDDNESDNLLEDLHIPDSRLIDGDAADLALIDPSTFEELHKAAECLLNLQGVLYFGEEENGSERIQSFTTS